MRGATSASTAPSVKKFCPDARLPVYQRARVKPTMESKNVVPFSPSNWLSASTKSGSFLLGSNSAPGGFMLSSHISLVKPRPLLKWRRLT